MFLQSSLPKDNRVSELRPLALLVKFKFKKNNNKMNQRNHSCNFYHDSSSMQCYTEETPLRSQLPSTSRACWRDRVEIVAGWRGSGRGQLGAVIDVKPERHHGKKKGGGRKKGKEDFHANHNSTSLVKISLWRSRQFTQSPHPTFVSHV